MPDQTDEYDNDPADPDEMVLASTSYNTGNKIYHDPDGDCHYRDQGDAVEPVKRGKLDSEWRICKECAGVADSRGYRNGDVGVRCPRCGERVIRPQAHIPSCDGEIEGEN